MQYRVEFLNNITCSIFENRKELEKWIKYNKKYYPIELEAKEHECSAIGFLTPEAAKILDYDYNDLMDFVASILDDMQKENENHQYSFKNLQIYLCR